MNQILMKIILFAIAVALVIGIVIPLSGQVRETGQKTFTWVKNLNDNISTGN